jgi:hypothetical protein
MNMDSAHRAELRHYPIGDTPVCGKISLNLTEEYGAVSCGPCRRELTAHGVAISKVHFEVGRKGTLCKIENDRRRTAPLDPSKNWSTVTCRNCLRKREKEC